MKRTHAAARCSSGRVSRGPAGVGRTSGNHGCHGDPRDGGASDDGRPPRRGSRLPLHAPVGCRAHRMRPTPLSTTDMCDDCSVVARKREPSDVPRTTLGPRFRGDDGSLATGVLQLPSLISAKIIRVFALMPRVDFLTDLCRISRLSMKTLALPMAGPTFWRMCARPCGGTARQTPSGDPGRRPAGFAAATGTSPYATSNPSDCGWSSPARRWQRPNNQDTSPIF